MKASREIKEWRFCELSYEWVRGIIAHIVPPIQIGISLVQLPSARHLVEEGPRNS